MQFINDFLPPEMLEQYQNMEYPFNLALVQAHLNFKLLEDPATEVFLPLVYFRHEASTTPGTATKLTVYKHFISNKGRVINLRTPNNPKPIEFTIDSDGYPSFTIKQRKKLEHLTVHRAVACAFVPPSGELKGAHPRDLVVVHLDNDKTNFDPSNLKWVRSPVDVAQTQPTKEEKKLAEHTPVPELILSTFNETK